MRIEFTLQDPVTVMPPLFVSLLALVLIGKVGGGFLTAGLAKLNKEHSLSSWFLMNGGELVELVIPSVEFSPDIGPRKLFSITLA